MIIDCHVHLNNYHDQVAVSLDESLDALQQAMAESGVTYSLVLTSYLVSPQRPSTAQVVKALENVPNLGVVAGISYNHYKERDLRELADFLKAGLVKALKLYPGYEPFYPHDRRVQVVYDLAEEFARAGHDPHGRHLQPGRASSSTPTRWRWTKWPWTTPT